VLGFTRAASGWTMKLGSVNGEPGLHVFVDGRLTAAMALDADDGRIDAVYAVVNPDKLPVTTAAGSASSQ